MKEHGAAAGDDNTASMAELGTEVQDPYAILGVSRDSSYEVIRRVYREKAKVCHPDLGSEPGREEEFKLLSWAHRIVGEHHREAERRRNEIHVDTAGVARKTAEAEKKSLNLEILAEGRDRLRHGAATEAERTARVALQRFRGDTEAYVLLAESLSAQSRFTEAIGCLLMALQIDKNCAEARELLAGLQVRRQAV